MVDSTVIIHLLRHEASAIAWAITFPNRAGVTSITWLEVMFGASGKVGQERAKLVLAKFDLSFPTQEDQVWAMEQMERYRLSRGVGINDCLIASVSQRLQVPIYTHNQKDFLKILPPNLVVKPY
ncbi:MAG: PIN domain-containing protein [Chloroflexota bacterium]